MSTDCVGDWDKSQALPCPCKGRLYWDESQILPLDVWKEIFDLLDFKSQINFISVCRYFKNSLFITNLFDIEKKYLRLLSDDILKNYCHIVKLHVYKNTKITNVSLMKNLKILNVFSNNNIDQK